MHIAYTDVLIIGGGLAGRRVAIGAKRRGHEALVLSLVPARRSHSAAAPGGMQASLGNVVKGAGDNEDAHFEDTVRGSDWGADREVVRMFANTAPKAVRKLAAWGVPWSRVRKGEREVIIDGQKVTLTERDAAHGLVAQRQFGGTKTWRTCYVSDGTGHAMLYAIANRAIGDDIPVHERVEALALIHDAGGRGFGAIGRELVSGERVAYVAKATVLASGGAGRLDRVTTAAVINEGIGHALALETGVAALGNREAVPLHPTGIFPAGILVTEGCRGDGGLLRDVDGHRFMPAYEPEKKELAARDVVSRRMEEHLRAWLPMKIADPDLTRLEERMAPEVAAQLYELDRCVECGCCVAACGTARRREDVVGAVGRNRSARFRLDPRDSRSDAQYDDLVGDDNGIFGGMALAACHDVCPKELPLLTQVAYLRRRMTASGWK